MRSWFSFRGWRERSGGQRIGWLGVVTAALLGGLCALWVGSLEALVQGGVADGMAVFFAQGFTSLVGVIVVVPALLAPWWPRAAGVTMLVPTLALAFVVPMMLFVLLPIGLCLAFAAPARPGDRLVQVGLVLGVVALGWLVGSVWGGPDNAWWIDVLESRGSRSLR